MDSIIEQYRAAHPIKYKIAIVWAYTLHYSKPANIRQQFRIWYLQIDNWRLRQLIKRQEQRLARQNGYEIVWSNRW